MPLPCTKSGYLRNPGDCSKYYRCVNFEDNDNSTTQRFEYECPAGLVFDDERNECNWPSWSPTCSGSGEILRVTKKKFTCPSYGYFQDPNDCAYFYYCSDFGKSALKAYKFKCPFDLAFDEEKLLCNWKWLVTGCTEALNPDAVDLNNYPHYVDNKGKDANQDLDNDREDLMERRSDDAEDVEFVDTPAEHRSVDMGSYSFTKAEGGRRNFARSIKDAVSGAISGVKNMLGMQGDAASQPAPDKRQDMLDPTMIAEESILSNWFTAVNPLGYANQLAQTVAKTLAPSRPPKKGEQFISIPIISVLPDEKPGKPPGRRPPPPKGQGRPRPDRYPAPGHPPPNHLHRGKPVIPDERRPRPSAAPTHGPRHSPRPSHAPVTGRPKKPKHPDLIPVPILTVREPPRAAHPEIQRRPDGDLRLPVGVPLAGSTKSYAIITVKPTRRMPPPSGRPRAEPEPEPSNVKQQHQRPRPRPEPEPEPEPQRKRKPERKPSGPPGHLHVGHNVQPLASINYPARERPVGLGVKPSVRPQKERPVVAGLPLDLFSNYDVDIKALDVQSLLANPGPIDLSQLHLLDALVDVAGPSKRPFGFPSANSPGAQLVKEPKRRNRGSTRKPSPPTPKRRPPQPLPQPPIIHLQPAIQLLPQFNQPQPQQLHPQHLQVQPSGIPLPRPTLPRPQVGLGVSGVQYQYQTENAGSVQFAHHQAKPVPLGPHPQPSPQAAASTISKNGFKPVMPAGAQYAGHKPNLQAASSQHYNAYSQNVPQSHYSFMSPQATTQWVPSTTRRPGSTPGLLAKTTKSSLLIIPVPDDHPKASNLNDLIRIQKDYPHLFPRDFDFSKVESVTRTRADQAVTPATSAATNAKPVYSGQQAKNETKSDYIMVVVNEALGRQVIIALLTVWLISSDALR